MSEKNVLIENNDLFKGILKDYCLSEPNNLSEDEDTINLLKTFIKERTDLLNNKSYEVKVHWIGEVCSGASIKIGDSDVYYEHNPI